MMDDELVHTIKHLAAQSQVEQRSWMYGHVESYDPNRHAVRLIVPSMRDDQTGDPVHTGWVPLGTSGVGGRSGLQIFPVGGANAENPTAGELAIVAINERQTGVLSVVALFYTDQQQPPNTALPTSGSGGDIVLRHQSGTLQWFHATGDVEITTASDGAISLGVSGSGGVSISSSGTGKIVLSAPSAEVDITAPTLVLTGDLRVSGNITAIGDITAGQGTSDQTGLRTHQHGTGTPAAGTVPPTAGT